MLHEEFRKVIFNVPPPQLTQDRHYYPKGTIIFQKPFESSGTLDLDNLCPTFTNGWLVFSCVFSHHFPNQLRKKRLSTTLPTEGIESEDLHSAFVLSSPIKYSKHCAIHQPSRKRLQRKVRWWSPSSEQWNESFYGRRGIPIDLSNLRGCCWGSPFKVSSFGLTSSRVKIIFPYCWYGMVCLQAKRGNKQSKMGNTSSSYNWMFFRNDENRWPLKKKHLHGDLWG